MGPYVKLCTLGNMLLLMLNRTSLKPWFYNIAFPIGEQFGNSSLCQTETSSSTYKGITGNLVSDWKYLSL